MISQQINGQLKSKHIFIFLILSCVILITRRPDVFFHPQLWAEDGAVFLLQVWNGDVLGSILTPRDGYFQTLPKVTMAFASIFDLNYVAFISVAIATSIRLAFIAFILSSRLNNFDIKLRILFVLYYLLQPNVQEGYINITNTHTYLAIYLLAIIISDEPKNKLSKTHDLIVLALSGVSGPFVALLAPSLALKRLYQHGGLFSALKKINAFDLVFSLCLIIQASSVFFGDFSRTKTPLGASLPLFFDIFSYKIIFGSFIDLKFANWVFDKQLMNAGLTCILIAAVIHAFIKTGWHSKSIITYIAFSVFVSLYKPVISQSGDQWPLLFSPIVGSRYFIITGMGLFCLVMYYLFYVLKNNIAITLATLSVIFVCLCFSYRMPRLDNVGYSEDVKTYNKASIGEEVTIRINPPGWAVKLIKN